MTAVSPSLSLHIDPMPGDQEQYYGFTQFAVELNELDSTLRPLLPPTDTRFRPDQRSALFICLQWLFVTAISDHLAKKTWFCRPSLVEQMCCEAANVWSMGVTMATDSDLVERDHKKLCFLMYRFLLEQDCGLFKESFSYMYSLGRVTVV